MRLEERLAELQRLVTYMEDPLGIRDDYLEKLERYTFAAVSQGKEQERERSAKLRRFDVQFCYKGKEVTRARLACPIKEIQSVCAMIYTMIAPYRGDYALNFIDCDVPDEYPTEVTATPVVRISKEEAGLLYDLPNKITSPATYLGDSVPWTDEAGRPLFSDFPIVPGSPAMQRANDCDMPDDQVQPHLTVE